MEPSSASRQQARFGLALFIIYTLFYAGFVLVNAFAADWVEWVPFAGLNLAIIWGFGLIALALALSLVYGFICKSDAGISDGAQK